MYVNVHPKTTSTVFVYYGCFKLYQKSHTFLHPVLPVLEKPVLWKCLKFLYAVFILSLVPAFWRVYLGSGFQGFGKYSYTHTCLSGCFRQVCGTYIYCFNLALHNYLNSVNCGLKENCSRLTFSCHSYVVSQIVQIRPK